MELLIGIVGWTIFVVFMALLITWLCFGHLLEGDEVFPGEYRLRARVRVFRVRKPARSYHPMSVRQ